MKRPITIICFIILIGILWLVGCQQPEVTSAKMAYKQSDYDKAIQQCQTALEKDPTNADAYFILGQAYGKKGMFKEMNESFSKSLENKPTYAQQIEQHRTKYWIDIFNSGVNYIKQDNMQEAVNKFKLAIEIMPDKINSYKNLAYAYTQLEQNDKAIETYLKAAEIDPSDMDIRNSIGVLYYQTEQYEKAVEALQVVIDNTDPISEAYTDALYNMAYAYDLMGESEKAIGAYKTALADNPNDKDLIFNMGRLFYMQDKYDQAIETFEQVLQIDPNDFEANINIGNAYVTMAEKMYSDATATDDRGNLLLPEAESAQKQQEAIAIFHKSIPKLEKSTQLKPDNANAWQLLGVAYVRVGEIEKGQEAFDKAEQLGAE